MPRRLLPLLILLCAAVLAACGGGDGGGGGAKKAKPTATAKGDASADTGCKTVPAAKSKGVQHLKKPRLQLDPSKTYVAQVATNCGDFEITLDVKRAPKTSASFVSLARKGFFDGLSFHRIVSDFVIQGGDPLGNGQGGPGYSVREAPPANLAYSRGVVAMAKTGAEPAGTSGSQFFVVTAEDAGLPPDYALLGHVTNGEDAVQTIAAVPVDAADAPLQPVVMSSVKIVER